MAGRSVISRIALLWRRHVTRGEGLGEPSGGWLPRLVRDEAAARLSGSSGRLLDVGCGEGLFIGRLMEETSTGVVGVDPWRDVLVKAKARASGAGPRVSFTQADARRLPFRSNVFASAACLNLTINLPDADTVRAVLSEAWRVLAPGGRLMADFRNSRSPMVYLAYKLAPLHDPEIAVPLMAYSADEAVALFPEAARASLSCKGLGPGPGRYRPVLFFEAVKRWA